MHSQLFTSPGRGALIFCADERAGVNGLRDGRAMTPEQSNLAKLLANMKVASCGGIPPTPTQATTTPTPPPQSTPHHSASASDLQHPALLTPKFFTARQAQPPAPPSVRTAFSVCWDCPDWSIGARLQRNTSRGSNSVCSRAVLVKVAEVGMDLCSCCGQRRFCCEHHSLIPALASCTLQGSCAWLESKGCMLASGMLFCGAGARWRPGGVESQQQQRSLHQHRRGGGAARVVGSAVGRGGAAGATEAAAGRHLSFALLPPVSPRCSPRSAHPFLRAWKSQVSLLILPALWSK